MAATTLLVKFYVINDVTTWTFPVDASTLCSDVLAQISKKLCIPCDDIAMYACYVREKNSEHEEQDRIDPESGCETSFARAAALTLHTGCSISATSSS